MKRALPAGPAIGLLLAILFLVAALFVQLRQPVRLAELALPELPAIQESDPLELDAMRAYDLNKSRAQARMALLEASPFLDGHAAFSRHRVVAARPKTPEYTPQMMGLLGKGDAQRAMIRWRDGADIETHAIGDMTPWGLLEAITGTQLIFVGDSGEKRLDLF